MLCGKDIFKKCHRENTEEEQRKSCCFCPEYERPGGQHTLRTWMGKGGCKELTAGNWVKGKASVSGLDRGREEVIEIRDGAWSGAFCAPHAELGAAAECCWSGVPVCFRGLSFGHAPFWADPGVGTGWSKCPAFPGRVFSWHRLQTASFCLVGDVQTCTGFLIRMGNRQIFWNLET